MKVSKKAYTALGVAAVILIGGYSAMSLHNNKVFLPNTVVAGTLVVNRLPKLMKHYSSKLTTRNSR